VHRFIETIPRRGYRFVAGIREWWEEAPALPALDSAAVNTISMAAVSTLAVLPFELLNANGCQNSLGLGIADALITYLSNLQLVNVRPTSAVRKYIHSENDTAMIGSELQVESVLEGSIQQTEKKIRVTVHLIRVRDGALVWGAKFDEPFTDIFTVEDSIASQVAGAFSSFLRVGPA
jgi:TolB-like protein